MLYPTRREENKLFRQGFSYIAGVDEAGRGAWAGPLVAAAVILPRDFKLRGINDSKKLSPNKREQLFKKIIEQAVTYCVAIITPKQIDRQGVGRANLKAIKKSVSSLHIRPEFILVDSFRVSWSRVPTKPIVKGDAKVTAIAAASIIAKVTRDRLMLRFHKRYPVYGFALHKGYGTTRHRQRLFQYGLCPIHRRSFAPMKNII